MFSQLHVQRLPDGSREIRGLRSRYSDVVHIQLNELIASFYLQRCLNVDEFLVDLRDAMSKVRAIAVIISS